MYRATALNMKPHLCLIKYRGIERENIHMFKHQFLLYANVLKVFRKIQSVQDAIMMPADLDRFEQWCTDNRMRLHAAKCVVLRDSRARCCVKYPYN